MRLKPKIHRHVANTEQRKPTSEANDNGRIQIWEKPTSREKYVLALDVSEGLP